MGLEACTRRINRYLLLFLLFAIGLVIDSIVIYVATEAWLKSLCIFSFGAALIMWTFILRNKAWGHIATWLCIIFGAISALSFFYGMSGAVFNFFFHGGTLDQGERIFITGFLILVVYLLTIFTLWFRFFRRRSPNKVS
jgi:hypothetical protein